MVVCLQELPVVEKGRGPFQRHLKSVSGGGDGVVVRKSGKPNLVINLVGDLGEIRAGIGSEFDFFPVEKKRQP